MNKMTLIGVLFILTLTASVSIAAPLGQEVEVYSVQGGDTLTEISQTYLGRASIYLEIVEATNAKAAEDDTFRMIENPDLIFVGQKLILPTGEDQPTEVQCSLSLETLQNAEYELPDIEGPFQLTDGKWEGEPFVEGAASRPEVYFIPDGYACGDLNDDGNEDATAVLVSMFGGSGSFYYVEAVLNENGEPDDTASVFLGDRLKLESITIEDGTITVKMVTHGPDDPMCCPTQEATKAYRLEGDELIEVESEAADTVEAAGETAAASELLGKVWAWQTYEDMAELNDITVPDPAKYTLEFQSDGTYSGVADCNLSSGGYTVNGGQLVLQPGPTTLAECEPGSLYDEYLAKLGDVVSYVLADGKLYLNLKMDAGNMVFAP
jgi:heat shock protein HslJ